MGTEKENIDREGILRTYSHKYRRFVTKKAVVTLVDKTEDMPKLNPSVEVSFGSTSYSMSLEEAKEIAEAIGKVLE